MIKVVPVHKDKKVIDPETMKKLPMEGVYIRMVSPYWKNRVLDGDVEILDTSKDFPWENIEIKKEKGK